MRELVVFAQTLAVIGKHHDDRVAIVSRGVETLEHPADLRIREGNLAVVRVGRRNARDREPEDA